MAAYSPDINVIENLWSEMKTFVHKIPCYSIAALVERIKTFISAFTAERCSGYIRHFKNVLQEIISRKGAWTDM